MPEGTVIQLLGSGALAYLLLRLVLPYVGAKPSQVEKASRETEAGAAGEQSVAFWLLKFRDIMKGVIEEMVIPLLSQERGEETMAKTAAMVLDAKIMLEGAVRERAELLRVLREVENLMRQHSERGMAARTETLVATENFRHSIEELKNLMRRP